MKGYLFGILSIVNCCIFANPKGEDVRQGECSFSRSDNTLTISNTNKAIIHWDDFSIKENEKTQFNQQSSTSQVLNRVVTNNPSHIHGLLESNGKVFLINQNGIVIGPTGVINTKGFVASTLNINDAEFLGDQDMKFSSENTSKIENHGKIFGDVYLIAREIQNTGEIVSDRVTLAAATEVILQPDGDRFKVTISGEGTLENSGIIDAVQVDLRSAGGNAFSLAINQEGVIHATGTKEIDGKIILCSENEGIVKHTGIITCQNENQTGGTVHILGEYVQLLDDATIDLSGDFGGGSLLCGGDYKGQNPTIPNSRALYVGEDVQITADANINGDGGKTIFWADELNYFYGTVSAKGGNEIGDGGFVEISSHGAFDPNPKLVDTSAINGNFGILLFDPLDVTVSAAANANIAVGFLPVPPPAQPDPFTVPYLGVPATATINDTALRNALNVNNVIIDSINFGSGALPASGSVIFDGATVTGWTAATYLRVIARNVELINTSTITNTSAVAPAGGVAMIDFQANTGGAAAFHGAGLRNTSTITTNVGDINILSQSGTTANVKGFYILTGSSITTTTGNVTINGTSNGSGSSEGIWISLAGTSAITSSGGTISLTGTGGSGLGRGIAIVNASITNTGAGTISLTGTSSIRHGVYFGPATVSTQTGSLSLNGQSGTTNGDTGVFLDGASALQSTTGVISVIGTANATAGVGPNPGIRIENTSTVTSTSGPITITGTSNAVTDDSFGVHIPSTAGPAITTSGDIVINGFGGTAGARSHGVFCEENGDPDVIAATGSGNLTINGTVRSAGAQGAGLLLFVIGSESSNISTVNGDLTINGDGGPGTPSHGIVCNIQGGLGKEISIQSTGSGNVILNATGGSGAGLNTGLWLRSFTLAGGNPLIHVQTNNGDVIINATEPSTLGYGIWMWREGGTNSYLRIRSTGNGNVNVIGSGGVGIRMEGSGNVNPNNLADCYMRTNSGNLTVAGTSTGVGVNDGGIYASYAFLPDAPIGNIDGFRSFWSISGDMTISGTGSGTNSPGIKMFQSTIIPYTGNASVTGIGSGAVGIDLGNTSDRIGNAWVGTATFITAQGNLTIAADSINLGVPVETTIRNVGGPGGIILQTASSSASIGVGTSLGTLVLDNSFMQWISTGTAGFTIGSATGSHVIRIGDVDSNVLANYDRNFLFRGNEIYVENPIDLTASNVSLGFNIGQVGTGIFDYGSTITIVPPTFLVTGFGAPETNSINGPDSTWNITSNNNGNVNGFLNFVNVGNLIGGNTNDTFIFADQQGVSGQIDGGAPPIGNTLDYTAYTIPAVIQWTGTYEGLASNMGIGFFNIENIIGNYILFVAATPSLAAQISLDLAYRYLHMNVGKDDLFKYLQFWFDKNVIDNPNAFWLMLNSFVIYKMLSNGLNDLKDFNIVNEPPPLNAVQGIFSSY